MKPRKIDLGCTNTPVEWMKNLSAKPHFPKIFFKRDDLTPFALGGNKLRKLEYIMAEVLDQKCDTIVVCGGIHSNFVRLIAAAARKFKIGIIAVFYGHPPKKREGNYLLTSLLDIETHFTGTMNRTSMEPLARELCRDLAKRNHKPYFIGRGGATAMGCVGYFDFVLELKQQLQNPIDHLVLSVGSCGTLAGIHLGLNHLRWPIKVWGISGSRPAEECFQQVEKLALETQKLLDLRVDWTNSFQITDKYLGPGYGIPTDRSSAAIRMVAQEEGVFLDPVFTGKAFAGLLGLIEDQEIKSTESVLFLHSGGSPSLFVTPKDLENG